MPAFYSRCLFWLLLYRPISRHFGVDKMKDWLFSQVYSFNVIIFVSIMVFNVALSKSNTQKMLQNQSKELYLEIEEVKDTIRELRK